MASQQRVQGWQGVSTYLRVGHESVDNVVDTAFEGVKVVQTDTNLGICVFLHVVDVLSAEEIATG